MRSLDSRRTGNGLDVVIGGREMMNETWLK
jgi:hypothetical protein